MHTGKIEGPAILVIETAIDLLDSTLIDASGKPSQAGFLALIQDIDAKTVFESSKTNPNPHIPFRIIVLVSNFVVELHYDFTNHNWQVNIKGG